MSHEGRTTSKMDPERKAQWVADLRSGEFEQGQRQLAGNGKHCCLGVLCEAAVKAGVTARLEEPGKMVQFGEPSRVVSRSASVSYLPPEVAEWAGFTRESPLLGVTADNNPSFIENGHTEWLSNLNDQGATFAEIADYIEEYF